jgi:mycofactocin precursor
MDDVTMGPAGSAGSAGSAGTAGTAGTAEPGGALALNLRPRRWDGDELVEDEELIEEILIDGICGVY